VDIWLSVWLNAAAEQVRDSQIFEQSTNDFQLLLQWKKIASFFFHQKCCADNIALQTLQTGI